MKDTISAADFVQAIKDKKIVISPSGKIIANEAHTALLFDDLPESGTIPSKEGKVLHIEDNALIEQIREIYKKGYAIFIPGNTPSLKSSREIQQMYTGKSDCCNTPYTKIDKGKYLCSKCQKECKLGKRPILGYSKPVKEFMENKEKDFTSNKMLFKAITKDWQYPIGIGMYFIRQSHHDFDVNNASHILVDLMTKYEWIPDDSANYIKPVFLGYHYSKENPGCIIVPVDYHKITNAYANMLKEIL